MKEKVSQRRKSLIILRYVTPVLLVLLLTAALFIPSLTCYIESTKTYETNSAASLAKNTWNTVRRYLFSSEVTEKNNITETFSKEALAAVITVYALFIIGALATVITSLAALIFLFYEPKKQNVGQLQRAESSLRLFPIGACLFFCIL